MKPADAFRASIWSLVGDFAVIGAIAALCFAGFGCARGPLPDAPRVLIDMPHLGELTVDGAAARPATVDVKRGATSLTVPAQTPVTIAPAGAITFTAAEPVPVRVETAALALTGPTAYPPPAAPTPSEQADGKARLWAWIAAGLGVVGVALGLFKGWPLVRIGGLCLVAGAVVVVALQSVPVWVWAIVGAGALLAVTGPLVWRFVVRKQINQTSPFLANSLFQ